MDEDESLHRYGLNPEGADLDEVRDLLTTQTRLMKLCCVQLFNAGVTDDVLLIWQAKTAGMDADGSIDIQLLCGSGLARTKTFLSGQRLPEAEAALRRLIRCEAAGDFDDFSTQEHSAGYGAYYAP